MGVAAVRARRRRRRRSRPPRARCRRSAPSSARPDARRACSGFIADRMIVVSGVIPSPIPAPTSTQPREQHDDRAADADGRDRGQQQPRGRRRASARRPSARGGRSRTVSAGACATPRGTTTAMIVNTSPASSALIPRPCCRYSASTRKNDACPHQNTSCATSPDGERARAEQRPASAAARRRAERAGAAGARTPPGAAAARPPSDIQVQAASRAGVPRRAAARSPSARRSRSSVPSGSSRARRGARDSGTHCGASASASDADRDVDQEAAAPAEPGDVGLDQRAADQLPARRRRGPSRSRRPSSARARSAPL